MTAWSMPHYRHTPLWQRHWLRVSRLSEVKYEQEKLREEFRENNFHMAPGQTRPPPAKPERVDMPHESTCDTPYLTTEKDVKWCPRKPPCALAA